MSYKESRELTAILREPHLFRGASIIQEVKTPTNIKTPHPHIISIGVPHLYRPTHIIRSTPFKSSVRVIFYSRNENDYQIETTPLIENDYHP